jgi:O-antigen ligase
MDVPPVLQHWSFGLFKALMLLWIAYVAGHTFFNIYEPYRPAEFALKNLLKTVELWVGPFLLILYFISRPRHILVRQNFPRQIGWCLLIALCVNIVIRLYMEATGGDFTVDANDPLAGNYFTIPVLNLMENVFSLRTLPPIAMLFCGAVVVTRWFKAQPLKARRLFYIVIALSLLGAVLSGGRATLAFVLALFAIFLITQRRIGILLGFLCAAAILIGTVNIFSGTLKNSSPLVKRSLNWALLEKDVDVSDQISASTNWRFTLFQRALDEWQSDPRIYWFGRATYSYGIDDLLAMSIAGDQDATIESALRRGATHNMLTDLLVIFGLVGLILYFSLYFALLYCLWKIYRSSQIDELGKMLALVTLINLAFNFVYGLLGGAVFPTAMVWLFVVLVAYLYRLHAETLRAQPAAKIEPPKGRRVTMQPAGGALSAASEG